MISADVNRCTAWDQAFCRLNAAPLPQTAATQLKVSIPPLADTARYDSLRADAAAATQEADHA